MSRPEIRKESYRNKFTNQRNGHHSFYLPRSTILKVPRHFSSLGASEGIRQSLQVCLLGSEQRQLLNAVDTGAKGLTTAPLVKFSPSEDRSIKPPTVGLIQRPIARHPSTFPPAPKTEQHKEVHLPETH